MKMLKCLANALHLPEAAIRQKTDIHLEHICIAVDELHA